MSAVQKISLKKRGKYFLHAFRCDTLLKPKQPTYNKSNIETSKYYEGKRAKELEGLYAHLKIGKTLCIL